MRLTMAFDHADGTIVLCGDCPDDGFLDLATRMKEEAEHQVGGTVTVVRCIAVANGRGNDLVNLLDRPF